MSDIIKDYEKDESCSSFHNDRPEEFETPNEFRFKINKEMNEKYAVKYDNDKLRYDLLPVKPLEELARVYTIGAKKYGDRNWEKGLKFGRVFGALMRHAWAWWRGETADPENGQHHLAAVAWAAFALIEYEQNVQKRLDLDDRPQTAEKVKVNAKD